MEIKLAPGKLRKAMEGPAICRRVYGPEMAKKIALRVAALTAAESLATFWPPKSGPERCHELIGDRAGTFSVDLKQPYRLLFRPTGDPASELSDERRRWQAITSITLMEVLDTHE